MGGGISEIILLEPVEFSQEEPAGRQPIMRRTIFGCFLTSPTSLLSENCRRTGIHRQATRKIARVVEIAIPDTQKIAA
jgi:hypothetical protein